MAKRERLKVVYCRRCGGNHPEGEHKGRPSAAAPAPKPGPVKPKPKLVAAVAKPKKAAPVGDGVAFISAAHPGLNGDMTGPAGSPTEVEIDAQIARDWLGMPLTVITPEDFGAVGDAKLAKQKHAKKKAAKKAKARPSKKRSAKKVKAKVVKKTKAAAQALVAQTDAKKRELKNARQQRWREKNRKPAAA